jgi:hypothetical protein
MLRLPENVRSTLRTLARSRTLLIDFACHCPPGAVATPPGAQSLTIR